MATTNYSTINGQVVAPGQVFENGQPLGGAGAAGASAESAGQGALTSQIPGYMTSMGNIGTNIASETAGEVPDDVIDQLKQQGAEGNVSTGAASNASYLKALGLTSLGLEQTGQNDLQSLEQATPGYNVSQNPEFQTSAGLANEETTQQQVFALQQQQQQQALAQQQAALQAAQAGLNTNPWGGPALPSGPAPGADMLGQPNTTTATLPGQTAAGGGYVGPWAGASNPLIAYGPGGGPGTDMGIPTTWDDSTDNYSDD